MGVRMYLTDTFQEKKAPTIVDIPIKDHVEYVFHMAKKLHSKKPHPSPIKNPKVKLVARYSRGHSTRNNAIPSALFTFTPNYSLLDSVDD